MHQVAAYQREGLPNPDYKKGPFPGPVDLPRYFLPKTHRLFNKNFNVFAILVIKNIQDLTGNTRLNGFRYLIVVHPINLRSEMGTHFHASIDHPQWDTDIGA